MKCYYCHEQAVGGKKSCAAHLERNRIRQREYWAKRGVSEMRAANRKWDVARALREPDRNLLNYRARPASYFVYRARTRARELGIPFDLTTDDIRIPSVCPLLGIPVRTGTTRNDPHSPSIDRIVPHLGYVRGNVWIISFRANQIKNDGTPDEHERIAAGVRRRQFQDKSRSWFTRAA